MRDRWVKKQAEHYYLWFKLKETSATFYPNKTYKKLIIVFCVSYIYLVIIRMVRGEKIRILSKTQKMRSTQTNLLKRVVTNVQYR